MAAGVHFNYDDPHRLFTIIIPLILFYLLLSFQANNLPPCTPTISYSTTRFHPSRRTPAAISHPPTTSLISTIPSRQLTSPTLNQPLPTCAHSNERAKSFLMIFMGHSGSSAILSELQSHSQTLIDAPEPVDHYEYETNTTMALEYARATFAKGVSLNKTAGFKMRPSHIRRNPEAWRELMREFGTRIVWQYRENLLKQAVGEYSNRYLNDSSAVEGLRGEEERRERCRIGAGCRFEIVDLDYFHRLLTDGLHSDGAIMRAVELVSGEEGVGGCVYGLPYEDYLYEREVTMGRVMRFLGLAREETSVSRWKATGDNMCEVVGNWEEVCERFYGCAVWRHMFEDGRNGCGCRKFRGGRGGGAFCDTTFRGG